jgi:uncharacterized RDD family membrane protein YckC
MYPQTYAPFTRRLAAHFIDTALFYTFVWGTQFTLLHNVVQMSWSGLQFELYLLTTVTLPVVLYYALSECSPWQATLGKRLMGLQVTGTAGERLPFGRALLRAALRFLPFEIGHMSFALPTPIWVAPQEFRIGSAIVWVALGVYVAAALLTARKQSIHDLAAGTVVVQRQMKGMVNHGHGR